MYRLLPLSMASFLQVVEWATSNAIDFVVVGPEDPLTAGVVDELEKAGILAFGPNKAAAELEGSKAFMKDILQKYNVMCAGIPSARAWKVFLMTLTDQRNAQYSAFVCPLFISSRSPPPLTSVQHRRTTQRPTSPRLARPSL